MLGLPSAPDRGVDGELRGGAEGQLGLDYLDLEQLLAAKMQELKVAPPGGARPKGSGRKPSAGRGGKEGDGAKDDGAGGEGARRSGSASVGAELPGEEEYARRVEEAALLFQLSQQEIALQLKINCPERARLAGSALQFFATVIRCLVQPHAAARARVAALQGQAVQEAAFRKQLTSELRAWMKAGGAARLRLPAWNTKGPASGPAELARLKPRPETFEACVTHLLGCLP